MKQTRLLKTPPPRSTLDASDPCNAANIYGEEDIPFARKQDLILAVSRCAVDPTSIPIARGKAERQLAWLIPWCNQRIWGYASNGPDPTPEQRIELRRRAEGNDHKEYRQNAIEVAAMHYLLDGIAYEEKAASRRLAKESAASLKAQEEAALLIEFEAHEAAEKQKRFEAWKAKR